MITFVFLYTSSPIFNQLFQMYTKLLLLIPLNLANFLKLLNLVILKVTRLHSSRMRTARSLTVSPSMLCWGGVAGPGGCLVRGVAWSGGGGIPACTEADPPPPPLWTEFLTHASENIILPQSSFAGGKN